MEPIRVLLVDDEEDLSLVLAERLQMRGFVADGVISGQEALRLIENKDYDVMVVDIKMPGLDGLELMKRIKARNPRTQIILFTGHGSAREAESALGDGAYDYLVKPIDIDDLITKIREAHASHE
jgi:DNA-binding NtrC family response regulator